MFPAIINPVSSYRVIDFRDDAELLANWGAIYRRTFRWQTSWGDWHEVHTAKQPTEKDADIAARNMALQSGYYPPRWYEFWRLGEEPLPPPPEAGTVNEGEK